MFRHSTARALAFLLLAGMLCLSLLGCGSKTKYDYDLTEYLEPADLSTITVSRTEIEEQLSEAKSSLQEGAAETEDLAEGDILKNGDTATIDYEGKMDGETFTGGSGTDYELELGSDSFIDGFEDGLVGKKVGDEGVVLNLTFPEDYRNPDTDPQGAEQFNGKPVEFTVTIKSAERTNLPAFDDAFVTEQTKDDAHAYTSVSAFEEGTRETITSNLAMQAYISACRMKQYPDKEYDEAFESYFNMYKTYASYSGQSVKEYVESQGQTMDQMYESINQSASTSVKQEIVYYYLARTNNITVSDEEYNEGAEHVAKENGFESVKDLKDAGYEESSIRQSVLFEKVSDFVRSQVTIDEDVTSDAASSGAASGK